MSEFKIEKGIPVPPPKRELRSGVYAVLRSLDVGDSFVARGKQDSVRGMACMAGKKYGRKFATRVVEGGVRVWRVA